jgi:tetratricopeptide (TPR) repeat protein
MKLLRILCTVSLILSAVPLHAQLFEDKPKKQAKELYEKATQEGSDHALQVKDSCQAAQLQPKEKKYSDACNSYRATMIHDDETALQSALLAYQSHDLEKAEILASKVSNTDAKLFSQAKNLLETAKSEKSSAMGVAEVKAAWERGDFNAVIQLAPTMTNPAAKATADLYVKDVKLYNEYIEAANKAQSDNPQQAINTLGYAYALNAHGPVDVKARIAELQNALAAKSNDKYFKGKDANPKPVTGTQAGTTAPNADTAAKVNKFLADARSAEKQGNSTVALSSYAEVLKLQPDNKEAQTQVAKLEQAIKTDPTAATNELRSAIRSFYQGQFDDARTALMDYLESPQTALNPGAADFYLGATLIERSLLRTPQTQWKGPSQDAISAFKQARKANYNPVRTYVSPILLKVWDSTGQ